MITFATTMLLFSNVSIGANYYARLQFCWNNGKVPFSYAHLKSKFSLTRFHLISNWLMNGSAPESSHCVLLYLDWAKFVADHIFFIVFKANKN